MDMKNNAQDPGSRTYPLMKIKGSLEALRSLLSLIVMLAFLFGLCLIALYSYWEGIPIPVPNLSEAMFVFSAVLVFFVSVVVLIGLSVLMGIGPVAVCRVIRRVWSGEGFREAFPGEMWPIVLASTFLFTVFLCLFLAYPQAPEAVVKFVAMVAVGAFASSVIFQFVDIKNKKEALALLSIIVSSLIVVSGFARDYVYSSMQWIGVRSNDSQAIVLTTRDKRALEHAAHIGGIVPRFCLYSDGQVILLDSHVVSGGSDDVATLRVGGDKQGEGVIIRLPVELITLPKGRAMAEACEDLPQG